MNKVYLVVGTPGSGKTWVCNQLKDKFNYIAHDDFIDKDYIRELAVTAKGGDKPVLGETPFGVSEIVQKLKDRGIEVVPVFIIESKDETSKRYRARDGKPIPAGHLTRIDTYKKRAKELKSFSGTSKEVLEHLQGLA